MEIGKQIRKYRTAQNLSQDELANKIYVTRQTISNWENSRSYPDIHSLVMLGSVFGISLDILVKGDLEEMKEQIKAEDIRKFNRDGRIYAALMIPMLVLPIPLMHFLGWGGLFIWGILAAVTVCWSFRVEKQKKAYDIQTFKEIVAFTEGKRLDEIQKNQEIGKRPYQSILLGMATAAITFLISVLLSWLLK